MKIIVGVLIGSTITSVMYLIAISIIQCVIGNFTLSAILAGTLVAIFRLRSVVNVHVVDLSRTCKYHMFDYIMDAGRALTVHRKVPKGHPIDTDVLSCHWDNDTDRRAILQLGRYAAKLLPGSVVCWCNNFEHVLDPVFNTGIKTIAVPSITDGIVSELNNKANIVYINSNTLKSTSTQKLFEFGLHLNPNIELKIV